MLDLLELVYEFGPSVGIILFFLGRDAAREERMANKIDELNRFIQNELIEIVKKYGTDDKPQSPKSDCPDVVPSETSVRGSD